jgi:predicted nuclease of predicted toxin-antitoxin system
VRFLVDGMFPASVCALLVDQGHDAVHVRDRGLDGRPDAEVAILAAREDRALVTKNAKDFAAERDLVVVCVLKPRLPARGMAAGLAAMLTSWAAANPDPYRGMHWPRA